MTTETLPSRRRSARIAPRASLPSDSPSTSMPPPSIPTPLSLNRSSTRLPPPTLTSTSRLPPPSPSRARAAQLESSNSVTSSSSKFDEVRFAEYVITPWHFSPYPLPALESSGNLIMTRITNTSSITVPSELTSTARKRKTSMAPPPDPKRMTPDPISKQVEDHSGQSLGKLYVCDLCFKYFRTKPAWQQHYTSCDLLQPPGKRVYQKGSYSIYQVDGAEATLYCQNLSLFGKLFIDVKSLFFHVSDDVEVVEHFLFYVLCDAATSKRDQVMAFFSKEKYSYDDYNLACIITFPQYQSRGFGRLLMEFSYHLTLHPSTRPASGSPGTPERPLSDLGLKSYTSYWNSVILRFCRTLLPPDPPQTSKATRTSRPRRSIALKSQETVVNVNGVDLVKIPDGNGQAIRLTLSQMSQACHIRLDDTIYALSELGFLRHRRTHDKHQNTPGEEKGDWDNVEVVISRAMVDDMWVKWRVKDRDDRGETIEARQEEDKTISREVMGTNDAVWSVNV
ncbi:hypothetical protein TREMEDRAFT_64226 [Tremella mesenterica DSM 1558]|uniref:uncharacterized protein n=1 Tax=Tremella mesenterica (strain ATCC 24925 / CBS 8224 / DSM 1558 / NBRC 9311 / NRRL Y-6157 / RJB 2259-6 / UBC 559-6) TaxID=578456 RepID=UPI0003F49CDF|nr:uncharacterized protein TREMEDRAFT_64226 [Tremella mesenterica DSM 1558]EIW67632.1 hypothetical protein TREMEDRAFT_64226 [Tremella mesenterica DSM 1558]